MSKSMSKFLFYKRPLKGVSGLANQPLKFDLIVNSLNGHLKKGNGENFNLNVKRKYTLKPSRKQRICQCEILTCGFIDSIFLM